MTLFAIEDFEDIARRLREIKPEPVKADPPAETEKPKEIDWGYLSCGDGA